MNSASQSNPELRRQSGDESPAAARFWESLGLLYRWRWFVIGVTGLVAVLSVVLSLLMSNWYAASSRLLSPEQGGTSPISAALSSSLGSVASMILGGSNGDYLRYRSILSSRTMLERVVREFNLDEVYETQDSAFPVDEAIRTLSENVSFPIDDENEYFSVVVMDRDPQRAADMANFLVRELNERNQELAATDAAQYRQFVERRYEEVLATLDSLKDLTQEFQETHGLFDPEIQATGLFDQIAAIRAEAIMLEIEYESLRSQYGESNPQVRLARDAYQSANRKSQNAMEGKEYVLPVAMDSIPDVLRTYYDLEQELLVQARILEVIAPMYEQARFQEEREYQALQIVDVATPPTEKARPRRSLIVVGATLSAFFLSVLFVLVYGLWQEYGPAAMQRVVDAANHKR